MSSEVQSRPAPSRGRGTGRGGRGGGYSTRGGPSRVSNRGAAPNGDSHDTEPTLEDEGEIGQLKQQYGSKISLINEMFPEWSDMDIVYALQEADGDENLAVTRIADGTSRHTLPLDASSRCLPIASLPLSSELRASVAYMDKINSCSIAVTDVWCANRNRNPVG